LFGTSTLFSATPRGGGRKYFSSFPPERGEEPFYSFRAPPERGEKKEKEKREKNPRLIREEEIFGMDSLESLFVQHLLLECRKEATYIFSGISAGLNQVCFGNNFRQKADCILVLKDEADPAVTVIETWNFHGQRFHNQGFHMPWCRLGRPYNSAWRCDSTIKDDVMKTEYAEALTKASKAAGLNLVVTYNSAFECDVFHSGPVFCQHDGNYYETIRELLEKRHPVDSCLGPGEKRQWTQDELVAEILARPPNSEGTNDFSGFLVLCGGHESKMNDGILPESFGFLHQRTKIPWQKLGPMTEQFILARCGGDEKAAKKYLAEQSEKEQTLTMRTLNEEGEVYGLEYFKWLVEFRGFTGFEIKHFLMFRQKKYLTPFVEGFLQRRHELRGLPGFELERCILKLSLNGECKKIWLLTVVKSLVSFRSLWIQFYRRSGLSDNKDLEGQRH
jgi:hypothetical protein